jgi:hypothetical protein
MKSSKSESLSEAISHLLEECRMVLPGIQALFGFQLIAVFNQRFETIYESDQIAHFVATGLIALSAGLVMTPAAFHREVEPSAVSKTFLDVATRLLLASMILLALGIAIDFYIIGKMITHNAMIGVTSAAVLFMLLAFLWFVFPYYRANRSD